MPQVCSICNHPKKLEIDRKLVEGLSYSGIGREYGVPLESLRGHKEKHLSRQLVQAYQKKDLAESMGLMNRIDTILLRAENIFNRNYEKNRDGMALKALSEQRSTIELLAKIAAYWHELRAMELQAGQGDYESQRKEEEQKLAIRICDRLNPEEQDLLEKLMAKINGERDEDIIPYYETICATKFRPFKFDEPVPDEPIPESEPPKRTRYPLSVQPIEPIMIPPYRKDR